MRSCDDNERLRFEVEEGGMLCESWTRLARLNFPDKVNGNVGGGLVARKKKKRETRQRGRDSKDPAETRTFKRFLPWRGIF